MNERRLPTQDLVLIGAGHTNLHVVRMWRMHPIPDVRLTLISTFSRATYSGMLPGTLAGLYQPDEMEIDLYRLAASCGARLIVEPVSGFRAREQQVLFAGRPPLRYDVAAIGIGSIPSQAAVWAEHPEVLSIKPMATFLARFQAQIEGFRYHAARPLELAVVGAGAGGLEITFCVEAWLRRHEIAAHVRLVDGHAEILRGYAPGTVRRARRELQRRGIATRVGVRVAQFESGRLEFADGASVEADLVIWATGAAPPPVLQQFELPKTNEGFLAVRSTLQTTADVPVFVVGDTASFVDQPVRKAGVYAVREGPVLWENIQRILRGEELIAYKPQGEFLSLLALGDGRALLDYRGISIEGRGAWRLKNYIDRKFMRMYQDYRPRDMTSATGSEGRHFPDSESMRCAGCGGKVGAGVLAAALGRLAIAADPQLVAGLNRPDDATVLSPSADRIDVLSVDFFRAFLEDPYLVGRVAAINALSDLWAMGAEPRGALALVTLPQGPPRQQVELLTQLLAGGLHELRIAGAGLWGGHTTEGAELSIGFSVAGALAGRTPFTKGNLRPGDSLILTKRLGTGALLAAHQQAACRAAWMDRMLAGMLQSNAAATRVAREFDAQAVTDVTGFGLAGHLWEMLTAGQVAARVSLQALPLCEGFRDVVASGFRSTLEPANRGIESHIQIDRPGLDHQPEYAALFDPQTSGGLLIAVAAPRAESALTALRGAGLSDAAMIGEVLEAASGTPLLYVDL